MASTKRINSAPEITMEPWSARFHSSMLFLFGKILFGQQLAYTLTALNPNEDKKFMSDISGYAIMPRWYGGVTLKAYGHRSEYVAVTSSWW